MKWIKDSEQTKQRRRSKGPWFKGRVGFCQTCGHRQFVHRNYGFFSMCKDSCMCEVYVEVKEHDFSKDQEYDPRAYGITSKEVKARKQVTLFGDEHDEQCKKLIGWGHTHAYCKCICHERA